MKDWKIIAVSGTLAFLFSFIAGLFGRVSLGVLFYRAVLGAVIFGASGYGISILLRKFLPELFELQSGRSGGIDKDFSNSQKVQSVAAESDDYTSDKPVIDISIGDETENSVSEESRENSSEQVIDIGKSTSNEMVDEIVESDKPVDDDQLPGSIDVLPDMGVFSNSFENAEDIDGDDSSNSGAVTLDIMGEEQDPELVVRALRTMVKKDQEG